MGPAVVGDLLLGRLAEPEAEGHWPPLEVIVQPAVGLKLGFLDDVGSVDAGPQPAVEAELHGLPQGAAVPVEQLVKRLALAGRDFHE
jgi:hypothetical protein